MWLRQLYHDQTVPENIGMDIKHRKCWQTMKSLQHHFPKYGKIISSRSFVCVRRHLAWISLYSTKYMYVYASNLSKRLYNTNLLFFQMINLTPNTFFSHSDEDTNTCIPYLYIALRKVCLVIDWECEYNASAWVTKSIPTKRKQNACDCPTEVGYNERLTSDHMQCKPWRNT